jgi:uncharacterized protein YcnI
MSAAISLPTADRGGRDVHRPRRRFARRTSALALTGALLVAGPAGAHPFVRGGELPVDSLATMTLAMAHGCGSETSDEGDATTEVSLEVPEWLRIVEVPDEDGWTVELEEDEDGRPEIVTWTADGAEEPAPDFDLDVVATGEVGDERYLRVFQACDEFAYRWIGTPDDPADDPAIRVTLVEADASSPPPPEPEPTEEPEPEPEPELTGEPGSEPDEPENEPLAAEDGDAAGLPGWFLPVTIVVLLGAIGALLFARRGRADA